MCSSFISSVTTCPISSHAHFTLCSALKTKHDTPKYGLLYHASVVGAAQQKNKGKMSRVLAAKAVLTVRLCETSMVQCADSS